LIATDRVPDVDPDIQADRYETTTHLLTRFGYERYEISNWARPGHACRHNTIYWCAGDYAAWGAGAHGNEAGRRYWRERLPRDYIASVAAGRSTIAGIEELEPDQRAGEALMLGLRLDSGISRSAFAARWGSEALEARSRDIDELESLGLLVSNGDRLTLSTRGTAVANEVLARLL
jgi:oxygen-independent coproporphyrinogen-3 oxidase